MYLDHPNHQAMWRKSIAGQIRAKLFWRFPSKSIFSRLLKVRPTNGVNQSLESHHRVEVVKKLIEGKWPEKFGA